MPVDSLDLGQFAQNLFRNLEKAFVRQPTSIWRAVLRLEQSKVRIPKAPAQTAEMQIHVLVRKSLPARDVSRLGMVVSI